MSLYKFKNTTYFLFMLLFFITVNSHGQNASTTSIHDWYDAKVGYENLDINSGRILLNYDKIVKDNDRFYFGSYQYGSVIYNGQLFNNLLLNYDINNDDLIIKPTGENDKMPIILNKTKIQSFNINNMRYVNLSYNSPSIENEISGFYAEIINSDGICFYVKHYKFRKKLIIESTVYDDFLKKTYYVLFYKNHYFTVTNKKSLISIFPEFKQVINDYYSDNNKIEKTNKIKFLEGLINSIRTNIK